MQWWVRIDAVLVCLGCCYNRAPWAGWLIHNKNLFLTVLEVQDCGTNMVRWGLSSKSQTSHCVLMWWKWPRELSGVSFIRALISLGHEHSWTNHLPKVHLPMPSHWTLEGKQALRPHSTWGWVTGRVRLLLVKFTVYHIAARWVSPSWNLPVSWGL